MERPEIRNIDAKKIVGIKVYTSLADDKTELLWNRFMKQKDSLKNTTSEDLYSIQIYDEDFIKGNFNSQSVFEKWAGMEVENFNELPENFFSLDLQGGTYAVFIHQGTAREFAKSAKFIFEEWLPESQFHLDNRPHFEVMGADYKGPDNPESKEEIWIPVKTKE